MVWKPWRQEIEEVTGHIISPSQDAESHTAFLYLHSFWSQIGNGDTHSGTIFPLNEYNKPLSYKHAQKPVF